MNRAAAVVAVVPALAGTFVASPAAAGANDARYHTDVDAVPFAGGDSDIGWGLGVIGDITRWKPEQSKAPYAWRLEASLFGTFKYDPLMVSYQDHWVRLTIPVLGSSRTRLEIRPSYTSETNVHYFGVGNAAPAPSPSGNPDPSSTYYEYGRTHPEFSVLFRTQVSQDVYFVYGNRYIQNWTNVAANSKLATDLRSASPETRALLGGDGQGGVDLFEIGASYDNRDSEIVTRGGTYDEIIARLSPTIGPPLPYSYGEIQLSFSAFLPVGSRVVLAGRLLGDGLFDRPPLWQLPNYSTTSAIGGSLGVRGVPAQRYYGKVKVLENAEARVDVWDFRLLSKPWTLALASFLDAGRVWADWSANPLLDGNGLGIKWGVGGGIRLEQGSGLVVRGDIAWSPDALPIAGYFAAGEIF